MARLTAQQLEQFERDGYLVVENVLSDAHLTEVEVEYQQILDRVVPALVAQGKLEPLTGVTFSERYCEAIEQLDDMYDLYQHLDISLPLMNDLDETATMHAGPAVFRMLTSPDLLDIVEQIIGPEIYSNPVQHARIKPPRDRLPSAATDSNVAATMWHQDAAVIEPEGDETDMLTVWLAMTDATVENGCLVVVPRVDDHTLHCPGSAFAAEVYIPDSQIESDRVVPLEVKAGGMVLLHRFTEHGSLENRTNDIRWSFDLRYQPIGQPTGRSAFPGFVARSAADPESVLSDPAEWAQMWQSARDEIASGRRTIQFGGRWDQYHDHPVCA